MAADPIPELLLHPSRRDAAAALVAGTVIALVGHFVAISVMIPILVPPSVLWFGLPAGALAGIVVSGYLGRRLPVLFQVAKFGLVGVMNTTIDLGALNVMMQASGVFAGQLYPLFKAVSFGLAVTNSYFWNRYWTFSGSSRPTLSGVRSYLLFVLIATVGFVLNVGVASILVNVIGAPADWQPVRWANLAAVAALAVVATWDFLGFKFIVFRPRPQRPPS